MTPFINPSPNPPRIAMISELTECVRASIPNLEKIKEHEATRINFLAMCEIAMSLPPSLFTAKERTEILMAINGVYGDPFLFLRDLNAGVSFVSKTPDCNGRSIQQIIMGVVHAHREEFGVDLLPGA